MPLFAEFVRSIPRTTPKRTADEACSQPFHRNSVSLCIRENVKDAMNAQSDHLGKDSIIRGIQNVYQNKTFCASIS
jgi:hypothetical protein